MKNNNIYELLIKLSVKANKNDEVPVACIITKDDKIISREINTRHNKKNVLGHAEINAIVKASKKIKDWRLNGCNMYVTLKPCEMCQKVIEEARIDNVFYLLDRKESKNLIKNMQKVINSGFELKYKQILESFFSNKR